MCYKDIHYMDACMTCSPGVYAHCHYLTQIRTERSKEMGDKKRPGCLWVDWNPLDKLTAILLYPIETIHSIFDSVGIKALFTDTAGF